jgi:hypothetical protein
MPRRPFRPAFPWVRFLSALAVIGAVGAAGYGCMMYMPGRSSTPPLPPLNASEIAARDRLRTDLEALAGDIGERNMAHPDALERAAQLIEERLRGIGYDPVRRTYVVDGAPCSNLEVTLRGKSEDLLVVGAHYDSARGSPGANDNGSGVVALIELARRLHGVSPNRSVALVFFVNEEPPYFATDKMGSRVWANEARVRGAHIVGAISLETMGFFTEAPHSQRYPFPIGAFYPDQGNFLGFVGNIDSRSLIHGAVERFREAATLPSEGAALPDHTLGVDWSDHASFWRHGWPGMMVTDTAPFRYPHYHTREDLPEHVDTGALARAVVGLEHVVRGLAGAE